MKSYLDVVDVAVDGLGHRLALGDTWRNKQRQSVLLAAAVQIAMLPRTNRQLLDVWNSPVVRLMNGKSSNLGVYMLDTGMLIARIITEKGTDLKVSKDLLQNLSGDQICRLHAALAYRR